MLRAKADKGERERIVARALEAPTQGARTATGQAWGAGPQAKRELRGAGAEHPALQRLRDSLGKPSSLGAATAAVDVLGRIRLSNCTNCDDEWPEFGAAWPRAGIVRPARKEALHETNERARCSARTN